MLIVKLCLGAGIVVVCGLLGMLKSKKYESREYILREAILLFNGIANEIKYSLNTIPNSIEAVRQNMHTYLKDVLGAISLKMLENNISAIDISCELDKLVELSSYDKQVITQGITSLGTSDVEGQLGVISLTVANLENQLLEAVESKKKNSKLYKTVGVATGLMIVTIFI